MYKRKLIFLIVFIFVVSGASTINAQFLNDEFCGNSEVFSFDYRKKPWKGGNKFLFDYLGKINYDENVDSVRFLVPVKFWVNRNNDGSGGASDKEIKVLVNDLNYYQKQNNTGFRFYIRNIRSINKTKRLKLGYFIESPLQTLAHHSKGCINVYVADTIKKKYKGASYLVLGTYNMLTKSVILQRKNSNTGLTHEIGHYFGLMHPHRNYKKGKSKQESVSRSRTFKGLFKKGLICEKNGDGLADTPAEPKLSFLVDANCKFSGQALTDNWGDHYESETSNIMSYPSYYKCRNTFTLSQKAVMLYTASKNKYATGWDTQHIDSESYRFDVYEPDNSMQMSVAIKNNEIQEHTFHKIFIPGKKNNFTDKADWLTFEIKNKGNKNIKIMFMPDEQINAEISISVYDKNENLLKNSNFNGETEPQNVQLNELHKGVYFIQVNAKQVPIKKLYTYSIGLKIN